MGKVKFSVKRKKEKMYKEVIITTIVIIVILGLNYITQNNTDETVRIMKQSLEEVKQELIKDEPNYQAGLEKANTAYERWEELDDKMAYYIEHEQIEKVKTAITSMQSFIQSEDESQAVESIDRCQYILEYIDEREKISLDNIF